jgi:hypothetical protein
VLLGQNALETNLPRHRRDCPTRAAEGTPTPGLLAQVRNLRRLFGGQLAPKTGLEVR